MLTRWLIAAGATRLQDWDRLPGADALREEAHEAGEPMPIKASNQPKFKAGKVLKDSVN